MTDYFDLGTHSRPITTSAPEAQRWFDRGLNWCYAFNHEESVRCFQKAAEIDPDCAMAHWGIAYASGPNYNLTWSDYGWKSAQRIAAACYASLQVALACSTGASPVEQALIQALTHRYPAPQAADEEEMATWNFAYAEAIREVYERFPTDLDVCSLHAEALITRTPWALWDVASGEPAKDADTLEAIEVMERAFELIEKSGADPHPGLLHMYIHTLEMSPHPERALRAADTLRELIPDAGHLLHMPSHIDILCGHYHNAVVANRRAIIADEKYVAKEPTPGVYTTYRCHNIHFKVYAAMLLGQFETAMEASEALVANISEEILRLERPKLADTLESLVSIKMHVLIRFGEWQAILDEPMPADQELYCHTTAVLHYAKGVAYSALGELEAATTEQARFEAARALVSESRMLFNNSCIDVLAIAAEMLNGELEYRRGNYARAFAHLRQSVALDDGLLYSEPWAWMQPTRHALGALLLEQDQTEDALQVYRADLGLDATLGRPLQHPDNVWSLHGYVEALHKLDRHAEAAAVQLRLDLALARADVPIHASCYCRLEQSCCDHHS